MVCPLNVVAMVEQGAVKRLVLAVWLILSGCATYTPVLVRLNPSGPDVKKATKGDLTVYVEEFVTGEKSERAFDVNMPAGGVLPMLMSVENNGREAFDVNLADIRLRGDKQLKLLASEDAAVRAQRGTAARALGWSMIVPIVTIPIAVGASAIHTGNVNQQIVRDFTAKGLPNGAVLPNKERSGFVFFETDDNRKGVAGLTLDVTVRNSNTGEPISVEILLSQASKEPTKAE